MTDLFLTRATQCLNDASDILYLSNCEAVVRKAARAAREAGLLNAAAQTQVNSGERVIKSPDQAAQATGESRQYHFG